MFRNLSLSGQLALLPIVASGSMLVVIVAGVVFGVAHGRVLSELELRLYPTRELLIEVEHDLLSFQQRLWGAVAAADVELLDEAGDRSSAMRSTLHDGIREGLRPPAELAGVEELIARHLDVAMSVTKQLLADGKGGVSSEAFTDLDTSYHDVVEKLEIWKAHTGSQIGEAFGYSQQLRGRFLWAMVGVGLFATALMVWLARAIHRSISEPIGAVLDLADRAAEGDLKIGSLAPTDLGRQSDAVPRLQSGLVAMRNGLTAILRESKSGIESVNLATRDLRRAEEILQQSAETQRAGLANLESALGESSQSQMAVRGHAESLADLARDSSRSLAELDEMIRSTDELADLQSEDGHELASAITELASATSQTSLNAQSLRVATESTEIALTDLQTAEQKTRVAAKTTHEASIQVYDRAIAGLRCVEASSSSLKKLSAEFEALTDVVRALGLNSNSIGNVVGMLESIVGDTTLLALNAAIVAAQAGEEGRAFSVVASEIRMLAGRASESTREIRDLLNNVQNQIQGTVESTDRGREFVLSSFSQSEQERDVLTAVRDCAALSTEQMEALVVISEDQKGLLDTVAESAGQVGVVASELAAATQQQTQIADRARGRSEQTRDRRAAMSEALGRAGRTTVRVAAAAVDVAERSEKILMLLTEQNKQVTDAESSVGELHQEVEVGIRTGTDLGALVAQLEERSEALERVSGRFSIDDSQ